jgi:hypothetical protein
MKRPDAVKAMFRCCLPGVEFVDSTPAKKKKRQASFKFPVKLTAAELRLVQAAIREHKAETAANRIIKLAGTMYPTPTS